MDIAISEFRYFFRLTGESGGLSSIDVEFKPVRTKWRSSDHMKAAARRCIDAYTEVLDQLFGDLIDGEREPQMTDTAYSISTGYGYRGYLPERNFDAVESRLGRLFGADAVDARGDLSPHRPLAASVSASFRKSGKGYKDFGVKVNVEMGHLFNVCFFRFTEGLAEVKFEDDARTAMDRLEQTLQGTQERENVDYYERLTKSGTV